MGADPDDPVVRPFHVVEEEDDPFLAWAERTGGPFRRLVRRLGRLLYLFLEVRR